MKASDFLAPKSPLTGGKLSLTPSGIIGLVLGSAVLMFVWNFGKKISDAATSKLPGNVRNFGTATPNTDPYAAKIIL